MNYAKIILVLLIASVSFGLGAFSDEDDRPLAVLVSDNVVVLPITGAGKEKPGSVTYVEVELKALQLDRGSPFTISFSMPCHRDCLNKAREHDLGNYGIFPFPREDEVKIIKVPIKASILNKTNPMLTISLKSAIENRSIGNNKLEILSIKHSKLPN